MWFNNSKPINDDPSIAMVHPMGDHRLSITLGSYYQPQRQHAVITALHQAGVKSTQISNLGSITIKYDPELFEQEAFTLLASALRIAGFRYVLLTGKDSHGWRSL